MTLVGLIHQTNRKVGETNVQHFGSDFAGWQISRSTVRSGPVFGRPSGMALGALPGLVGLHVVHGRLGKGHRFRMDGWRNLTPRLLAARSRGGTKGGHHV